MDPSAVILVDLILLMISGMVEVIRTDTTTLAVLRRVRRQIPRNIKQGCTTTGYEKRVRELCEEVLETICTPIKEVEYRKEIQERCDTRLQQKCNTTTRERPRRLCRERTKIQCYPNIKLVTEVIYDQECDNIVQHVCEELYHVPVPVRHAARADVTPRPIFSPASGARLPRSSLDLKTGSILTSSIRPRPSQPPRFKRQTETEENDLLLTQLSRLQSSVKAPTPNLISHQEVPAPPGCRTVVTQSCRKIPVEVKRKLPDEKCEEVPDIVCHLELEKYEEPVCEMVPVEECEDLYKEIPFLVDDEKCEDIPKLQCTEVEEEVPIQVCTSIDVQRDIIISNRGETFTTTAKKPGAEVVGAIPPDDDGDEEEEEDRGGRVIEEDLEYTELIKYEDNDDGEDDDLVRRLESLRKEVSKMQSGRKLSRSERTGRSKAKKLVDLLRKLLLE